MVEHAAYPWLVAAPVVGLATYTVCHLLLARFTRGRSPYPALIGAFVPGLLLMAALTAWALVAAKASTADAMGQMALNGLTYAALGWGYFHFVNMGIASLRIRMLRELIDAGGLLSRERLLAGYNTEAVIHLRITRLTAGGHFIEREGRYYGGKKKFLLAARVFDLLRRGLFGASYLTLSPSPTSPRSPQWKDAGNP